MNKTIDREEKMEETFTHRNIDSKWYPRITYLTGCILDKGIGFKKWLQNNGRDSDRIAEEAGKKGSRIHKACEMLLKNGEIIVGAHELEEDDIKMVYGFRNFLVDYNPVYFASEQVVNDGQVCGRYDYLLGIGGLDYIIDIKTGSSIYDEHYIQQAFYNKCLTNPHAINNHPLKKTDGVRSAILHLKDNTKKGYQFIAITPEEQIKWKEAYELVYRLYVLRGFPLEPKVKVNLPKKISLNEKKTEE
jgi:hypothetical protein